MRRSFPILLLLLGTYLLVGCIPVPSTQQFMVNGKLKPSYSIGTGEKSPVRIHYTRVEDAIDSIDVLVAGLQQGSGWETSESRATPAEVRQRWLKIDDERYVLPYNVRTATIIWPLCAMAEIDSRTDYLLLRVKDGLVVGYDVSSDPGRFGVTVPFEEYDPLRWQQGGKPDASTAPSTVPAQEH